MAVAIRTRGLSKVYRGLVGPGVEALTDLNLDVREGTIFGLVGPNGSGKTTTLKLLLGLIFPTSGTIEALGEKVRSSRYRSRVGFLPDGPYFYDYLNADELLRFYGGVFGLRGAELRNRVDELLELVDMAAPDRRRRRVREYSKGMIQRVGVAQAMINDPDLLYFDEPTSGLDPQGSLQMREIILRLRERGKTVFLCSHLLAEVERICDDVTILNEGQTVRSGSIGELLEGEGLFSVRARQVADDCLARVRELAQSVQTVDGGVEIVTPEEPRALEIADLIRQSGGEVSLIGKRRRSLEDVFIESIQEAS
ncbi:MAG: ABC transporter ATP-binding protein [Armatimonadota bacterium]